jgi:hypothetical protein
MFKSKTRPINIPQYEHGRLSGELAAAWGNEAFDRPAIEMGAFIQGVALHDWHYGPVDNLPIGEASVADWLVAVHRGAELWFADPVTDIVAKLHLKRLISHFESPVLVELGDHIEARVTERLPQTDYSREQFEWAGRITRFCDTLAFDFSFEQPDSKTVTICSRTGKTDTVAVTYAINPPGEITVTPWPFNRPVISGILIGYERAGYPDKLQPTVIQYYCRPG